MHRILVSRFLLLLAIVFQSVLIACGTSTRNSRADGGGQGAEFPDSGTPGGDAGAVADAGELGQEPITSIRLIAEALDAGTIDYPTSLQYRAYALFGDSRLPPEYDGKLRFGEDQGLFLEASRVWGTLTDEERVGLEPFMLRPTEDGSIYSPKRAAAVHSRAALAWQGSAGASAAPGSLEDSVCPEVPETGLADWRWTAAENSNFVVWSCGGGDLTQDPDLSLRETVAAVAEDVWSAMTKEAGKPRPDDFKVGPLPQDRIDVYVVKGAQCKQRQKTCAQIETDERGMRPIAAAIPAQPCDRTVNGAETSSAFILVDRDSVNTSGHFRYAFAHEFFHVLEDAKNLEAQGGSCFDVFSGKTRALTSWLTEASAEWASWAFFPDDDRDWRSRMFLAFQRNREPHRDSLLSVEGQRPYEAFIYPFFVQQEAGGDRSAFLEVWDGSASARTPNDLNDLLDQNLSFADHFRDFAVQNFNTTLELPASEPHYQTQDTAIPTGVEPNLLPDFPVNVPGDPFTLPIALQPLAAQYQHFKLANTVRYLLIDAGAASDTLDADALANIRGQWQRRKGTAGVLEFCREKAEDDVGELVLVVSNHARRPEGMVHGAFKVDARASCPAAWRGSITALLTYDEDRIITTDFDSSTYSRHEKERQSWTITTSSPAGPVDILDARWSGSYEGRTVGTYASATCHQQLDTDTSSGDSTAGQALSAGAVPNGVILGGPGSIAPVIAVVEEQHHETCEGIVSDSSQNVQRNPMPLELLLSSGDFNPMKATKEDPNHFIGTLTVLHQVQQVEGGMSTTDLTFTWDLIRVPSQ
jgi:hypothetical protein